MRCRRPSLNAKLAGGKSVGATNEIKRIRVLTKGLENRFCADIPRLSARQQTSTNGQIRRRGVHDVLNRPRSVAERPRSSSAFVWVRAWFQDNSGCRCRESSTGSRKPAVGFQTAVFATSRIGCCREAPLDEAGMPPDWVASEVIFASNAASRSVDGSTLNTK